jgi:hypothetical protein
MPAHKVMFTIEKLVVELADSILKVWPLWEAWRRGL